MIPLQNPKDGWRGNYGCWIRLFFISFFVTFGAILQSNALVPDLKLSVGAIICASLATASVYIVMMIGVAAMWVFPTPFAIVISSVPFALTSIGFFILAVGPSRLAPRSSLRQQVVQRLYMVAMQAILMVVYPSFSAVYFWLPPDQKLVFVFLLPMIKVAMQHLVTWALRDLEEYLPSSVVFCIGVFNALYTSKCMQSAGSRVSYGVIIALDTVNLVQSYRRLKSNMARIRPLAQGCGRENLLNQNLLEELVKLSQEPGVLQQNESSSSVRIRSPTKSRFSHLSTIILDRLASNQYHIATKESPLSLAVLLRVVHGSVKIANAGHGAARGTSLNPQTRSVARSHPAAVVPVAQEQEDPSHPAALTSIEAKSEIMRMALKLLFECEYHVLVEYVESIIPMMYATYVLIVGRLSSAEYYPETLDKTATQVDLMAFNIAMYAWIEGLSFLVMQISVEWRSGLSSIYILAFVIENQGQEMIGQLFVWYVVLLQLTLAHFGVDFSLRFAWPKHEN